MLENSGENDPDFLNNLKGKVSGIMESRHRTDTTTEERTVLPMKRDRKAGT